jgi:periplasmic glucans biosynthesis protein
MDAIDRQCMKVRQAYAMLLCLLVCRPALAAFSFEDVRAMAEARAAQPYQPDTNTVSDALIHLNYEQYVNIRFKDQKALWRDDPLPFCLEFFLPGYWHKQVVTLHQIDGAKVRDIRFDTNCFVNTNSDQTLLAGAGYAGFRVVRHGTVFDEVAAFLDASYFRMIGQGQDYGTAARGLALNTVANEPEEFPVFQQFWIRQPGKDDHTITVYALMDSPSVAGAYRFNIRPGMTTVTAVKAALFPRRTVKEFGIAPLTSMFLYGENGRPPINDFRPEVHDADGLLMHNGYGEWLWRPLETGKMTRVDAYQDENPHGFGLMQRDRNFDHYQDLVAKFQRRPSVWVQPIGNWGKSAVELVQLASDQEFFDNVVAFWVPAVPPPAGKPFDIEYELRWTTNDPSPPDLGHVSATRIGETAGTPPHLRFLVEFDGPAVESLPATENLSASIDYSDGAVPVTHDLFKNEFNQTWRLVIEIVEPRQVVNLRAYLKRGDQKITETWNFTWQP